MKKKKMGSFAMKRSLPLLILMLPGLLFLLVNNYIPMIGTIIAFKNVHYGKNIIETYIQSEWVGFDNFKFFLATDYAWIITRNTLLYNLVFIFAGAALGVTVAIALNEIKRVRLSKFYQSVMILPNFLSWIVISGIVYAFLADGGFMNSTVLKGFAMAPVAFYNKASYWPFIIVFVQIWAGLGVNSVIYLAAIIGIGTEFYEAAMIDGATRWQQIKSITLPLLKPTIITLILMNLGGVFTANFGLFYNVPRESGILFSVTNVLDTYVFRSLRIGGEIEMASAASFYQSVVGFAFVMISNGIIRKYSSENSLF
jgi:putative aldouronate transport system permease protein